MNRFKENARVVFLGDSITSQETWHSAIYQYYLDEYPRENIRIYNAGIAGATAQVAWLYRHEHLYRFQPTHVNLMFGMNDIGRGDHGPHPTPEQIQRQGESFERHRHYLTLLTEELKARGITVTYCTPTPYDGQMVCDENCLPGCVAALERCAEFVRELSRKHGLEYVDFNTELTALNRALQRIDPRQSLIGPDRVHPTAEIGHLCMARIFLRAQGFEKIQAPTIEAILSPTTLALPIGEGIRLKNVPDASFRRLLAIESMLLLKYKDEPLERKLDGIREFIREKSADAIEYFRQGSVFYLEHKAQQEDYFRESLRLSECLHRRGGG
jgi:hypothetical protein